MDTWQIDALDPRGGIAFASWREFSLTDEVSELREAPCVMICAPYFRPEPVASRALARSAPRGCFQIGVFAGESEVSFTTLEAVAEFVRRIYVRSAGSDGIEGGSTPVPPRPEGGGSPLPALPLDFPYDHIRSVPARAEPEPGLPWFDPGRGAMDIVEPGPPDIPTLLMSFKELARHDLDGPVSGEPMSWRADGQGSMATPPTIGSLTRAEDILGWAALLLMHEMLERLPAARLLDDQLRWQEAARGLGQAIARLGLWDWLFGWYGSKTLEGWADAMRDSLGWPNESQFALISAFPDLSDDVRTRICMWLLFGAAPTMDHDDWIDWIRQSWEAEAAQNKSGRLQMGPLGQTIMPADPLHLLKLTPLPAQLAYIVADDVQPDATLYHLLAGSTAAPARLLADDARDSSAAIALLLFAACLMVLEDTDTQVSFGNFGAWGTSLSPLQKQRLADLMTWAWDWLSGSLPRLAFPQAVEQMITDVTSLRYGDGWTDGGVPAQPNRPRSPLHGDLAQEVAAQVAFGAA